MLKHFVSFMLVYILVCTIAAAQTSQPIRAASADVEAGAVRIHPENGKYFLFRGKPLVLIAAGEHYGSVVNREFDFDRYLEDAADKKQTMTRTFLLFREQQSSRNPSSPIKPESPDYIAPYPRVGPGNAGDGEPIYDLDQWNPEYFQRLRRFLDRASALGIVVELTVLSNTYTDSVWALNPLKAENNKQGVGKVAWQDYNSLKKSALVERQVAYAKKIVQFTSHYDNIYYEICNEAGGGLPDHSTPAEVDAWQMHIGQVLRDELKRLGRKRLIFGLQAFSYTPEFTQPIDESFASPVLDAVNVHALPGMLLGGRKYQLGNFMSKELSLGEYASFFEAAQKTSKPCVQDEDNCASMYRDEIGWTIHRKRAWMAVMSQAHYDYIDFSITTGSETGTKGSQRTIRTWMKHLSEFIHSFDFIHAKPLPKWIESKPDHAYWAALGTDSDFIAYFADGREWKSPDAGKPIEGDVAFRLPAGSWRACLYSPSTGLYSPCIKVRGGDEPVRFTLPSFKHDIVLRVTKEIEN